MKIIDNLSAIAAAAALLSPLAATVAPTANSASVDYYGHGCGELLSAGAYSANSENKNQWGRDKSNIKEVWDELGIIGSSSVKVGVIDDGIDGYISALSSNIDTAKSKDFSGEESPLKSRTGHGTAIAGIIGGNTTGYEGVCKKVSIVSLKVNETMDNATEQVIRAIEYASGMGIPILNISLSVPHSSGLESAIKGYNGLIVCAAGNDTANIDVNYVYPASYAYDNIITVGAYTYSDEMWEKSNYGARSVDLFAPGRDIFILTSTGFDHGHGTSYAAPYVSGTAALLLSKYSYLKTAELKASIMQNVAALSSVTGQCVSGGRLNAYNAIKNYVHTHTYNYVPTMARSGLSEVVSPLAIGTGWDMVSHTAVCTACNYKKNEEHSWVFVMGKYTCKCGLSSSTIPMLPEY